MLVTHDPQRKLEPLPTKWESSVLAANIDAAMELMTLDELSTSDGIG